MGFRFFLAGMVQRLAYGSPTPLIWVRILVPVLMNMQICKYANLQLEIYFFNICTFAHLQICTFFLLMNKFTTFVKESYKEMMEKVSWPKWEQLQQSTMIVLGATIFITAIVALMDFVANGSMKFIYSLFK